MTPLCRLSRQSSPVAADLLGRVLMHEHIFVILPRCSKTIPRSGVMKMLGSPTPSPSSTNFYDAGISTILDPTAIGLGRYIPRIQRVASETKINIVAATGHYTFNELPHYYRGRPPEGRDILLTQFVRDITDGIAETTVKAGVIKCATDKPGVTPDVERVLLAAAHAHRETGCPITTHTHARTERGADQMAIFQSQGVDMTRVVIGHCGDTDDLDYLSRLADSGAYLGMDRFGIDGYATTEQRVAVIASLCERGYADQLVLSHDGSCYIDWIQGEVPLGALPNWHYLHISRDVIPMLLAVGVSEADVDKMLVAPAHVSSSAPPAWVATGG
ncbi:MAG: hypothetical protein R2706_19520 [Acidimicrobiales bacterium]